MGTSSIQITDHPHGKLVEIRGVIDETFDLTALTAIDEIVLFDLDGVKRMTSFGIREWREALSNLEARYLGFVRCRPAVLAQFNLVPGFGCGGELISFYLPYICMECDHFDMILLDRRTDDEVVEWGAPPDLECSECGAQMEFDDIPTACFRYARLAPRPRPPFAAVAMIDDVGTRTD
jgi:hypothetical protein